MSDVLANHLCESIQAKGKIQDNRLNVETT